MKMFRHPHSLARFLLGELPRPPLLPPPLPLPLLGLVVNINFFHSVEYKALLDFTRALLLRKSDYERN